MTRPPSEEFWSLVCDFRDPVIVVWSVSVLSFFISAALLATDATDEGAILKFNLLLFAIPIVISFVILSKCKGR